MRFAICTTPEWPAALQKSIDFAHSLITQYGGDFELLTAYLDAISDMKNMF